MLNPYPRSAVEWQALIAQRSPGTPALRREIQEGQTSDLMLRMCAAHQVHFVPAFWKGAGAIGTPSASG